MRIFLNVKVHHYTKNYGGYRYGSSYRTASPSTEFRTTEEVCNIAFTNKSWPSEIQKRIKELTVDKSTLPKPAKIYFDPCCKYPRYKLKDNADFKRVIKQPNADIVIYTEPSRIGYGSLGYKHRNFLINGEIYSIDNQLLEATNFREFLKIPISVHAEELLYSSDAKLTNDVGQSLYNLFHVYTKIISETELDMIINSTLMNMTNEDYLSISGMLKSKDEETFKLGLKMLIGYNTNSNAVRIGTLLRECCADRSYKMTDVNTTQIMATLGISRSELSYPDMNKTYVKKLVEKSTSDDDKAFARDFIIQNAYETLRKQATSIFRGFEDFEINVDLKIT